MTALSLSSGQRALLAYKIHVQPGALARSGGAVQEHLPSVWHAATLLADSLAGVPNQALHWWAEQTRGHVLLTAQEDRYLAGTVAVAERTLSAVSLIPLATVVHQQEQATLRAILALDHLLGCGGHPEGRWLSEGGGISERWQRIGDQLANLFVLGYGLSDAGRADAHVYFAEGVVTALRDLRRLNSADPKLDRLLHSSLLSEGFWRNFLRESTR